MTTVPITNPDEPPEAYELTQEDIDALYDAVARGDTLEVIRLSTKLQLGPYTYDILMLTEQSNWYGPLESNGDALISLLQTHKEGKVEINDHMKRFLEEAKAQMEAAGTPLSGDQLKIYNKVINGEDIDEEEAKTLYSWALDAKELVIPSEFRSSVISQQIETAIKKRDQVVDQSTRRLGSYSVPR